MNHKHMEQETYDLLVVGGGINGVGIALDAAGRGLKVALCEMNDLASATSSNSSKLIHGGLRYLEHYEFRLVREALSERELLLKKAPHIMRPLRFRMPHRPHLRPAWMIRAGLFLYDHLSKRQFLPGSHGVRFSDKGPLKANIKRGFEYSDGWVDDARLVVLNAIAAREKGANIMTRTRCVKAERKDNLWQVTLKDQITGKSKQVTSRALVNAAGPWVTNLFDKALPTQSPQNIRLIKGSHIIVPKLHDEPQAYILQNEDHRIVFVIPYEENFSLIGTTDVEHHGDPSNAKISEQEVDYLVSVVNDHFKQQITSDNIVSTYAGVRPLMDDESDSPQALTRDYTFEIERPQDKAPLLSVFGGKITTYRKLAEAAINRLTEYFPHATPSWTATPPLPGGDFSDKNSLQQALQQQYPWLAENLAKRYVRSYGTLSFNLLSKTKSVENLGQHFGKGLYQREVDHLIEHEWAMTAEDILWRRSKLGLYMSNEQQESLVDYLHDRLDSSKVQPFSASDSMPYKTA